MRRGTRGDVVSSLALDVWLWLETFRLGEHFESAKAYAASPANKWPDSSRWRNRLLNVKVFGPRTCLGTRNNRHPRDRILNALALLLWTRWKSCAGLEKKIRQEIFVPKDAEVIAAYREKWRLTS